MKTIYSLAMTFALLASAGIAAAEPAKQPATSQDSSDDEEAEDVVTCKKEGVTGSRVKKHTICASENDRRRQREQTEDALDGIRVQGTAQRSNGS